MKCDHIYLLSPSSTFLISPNVSNFMSLKRPTKPSLSCLYVCAWGWSHLPW